MQRDDYVVSSILTEIGDAVCLYFDRRRTRKKTEKIDKVTDFPKNASATLLGIIYPMILRERSGIHAIMHGYRLV